MVEFPVRETPQPPANEIVPAAAVVMLLGTVIVPLVVAVKLEGA